MIREAHLAPVMRIFHTSHCLRQMPTFGYNMPPALRSGPGALQIAALNDLFQLCPPWLQAGCALNAVNRQLGQLAADARRRQRKRLLALRDEIRQHKFVKLRHVTRQVNENLTHPDAYSFRIHHVKGEHVTVESICIRYDKNRFCIFNVSLNEWESKFAEWIEDDDDFWVDEWESGFESYFRRYGDSDDD